MIGTITEHDVQTGPNVALVVGTSLKVLGTRMLVRELCCAAKRRGGFTVWARTDVPPHELGIALDARSLKQE